MAEFQAKNDDQSPAMGSRRWRSSRQRAAPVTDSGDTLPGGRVRFQQRAVLGTNPQTAVDGVRWRWRAADFNLRRISFQGQRIYLQRLPASRSGEASGTFGGLSLSF
ncbi:unnamed protein product [Cuscuta epithymum]|uniref:Uncharacterized protein n=1 Tax=Cuscuta epithymum TaxID=186058 RepID=A0AAV0DVA0_9ASTE|nr:unnamed protein product [Cuscuta epithymum]